VSKGFEVYTDGSCWTGDRIGAWAWVAVDGDDAHRDPEPYELGGGAARDTTISRMELLGPLEALLWIFDTHGPSYVMVYSDSEYVVLGITHRHRARRKNTDLWDDLDLIVDSHEAVEFEHVKGHAGNHYNEICDEHAGKLRKAMQG
jgi:ribonuclease HI